MIQDVSPGFPPDHSERRPRVGEPTEPPAPSGVDWVLFALILLVLPLLAVADGLPMPGRIKAWLERFESRDGKNSPLRWGVGVGIVVWALGGYLWLQGALR